MKSRNQVRKFLKKWYKQERLEGRGSDYAESVVSSVMYELEKRGSSLISRHESITGEAIFFDDELNIHKGEKAKQLLRN